MNLRQQRPLSLYNSKNPNSSSYLLYFFVSAKVFAPSIIKKNKNMTCLKRKEGKQHIVAIKNKNKEEQIDKTK